MGKGCTMVLNAGKLNKHFGFIEKENTHHLGVTINVKKQAGGKMCEITNLTVISDKMVLQ